jgi:hypothetical protein
MTLDLSSADRGTPVELSSKWVVIEEPHRVWRFERAWLVSNWGCVFGNGCRGIHPTQDPNRQDGCCTYGAHFAEGEDFVKVARFVPELSADVWQFRSYAKRVGWFKRLPDGRVATRVVQGGCVFLNRPGFAGGTGCALHVASAQAGRHHVEVKPDVCWELPLRTEDGAGSDGRRIITVRRWDKGDFGPEGDAMTWWCTDPDTVPEAFRASDRVIDSLARELTELCGPAVYDQLRSLLDHP